MEQHCKIGYDILLLFLVECIWIKVQEDLKNVWQIVSNFWFKLCFLCIFFRVTPNFYVVVCMVDFFQPSLNWWVFLSIYSGIPLISQPWRHIGVTYSKRPWYSVYPKIPTLLFHHHRVSKSFYISQAGSYIYQCITLQTHFGMHINVISKKKSWNKTEKIFHT